MRKLVCSATVAAAIACLGPRPAVAADPAPAGPSGPAQALIDLWQENGKELVQMAEDFPEAKYDYKPTPEVRSFAEQLLHAADANFAFVDLAAGRPPQFGSHTRAKYDTKAKVVEAVKQSIDA